MRIIYVVEGGRVIYVAEGGRVILCRRETMEGGLLYEGEGLWREDNTIKARD